MKKSVIVWLCVNLSLEKSPDWSCFNFAGNEGKRLVSFSFIFKLDLKSGRITR